MHVQVKDFLPRISTAVDQQTIATLCNSQVAGNLLCDHEHVTEHRFVFFGHIIHCGDFFVRHDQDVNGRDGVDVFECRHSVILKDDLRRDFVRDDFGEYGWHVCLLPYIAKPPSTASTCPVM